APVAQAVIDCGLPAARLGEPRDDRPLRVRRRHAAEAARVDQHFVRRMRRVGAGGLTSLRIARDDDSPDGEVERRRELEVARVVKPDTVTPRSSRSKSTSAPAELLTQ